MIRPVRASTATGLVRVQLQRERLENNVHVVEWELTPEEVAEVNAITNKD